MPRPDPRRPPSSRRFDFTKIIATVGPASAGVETLRSMIRAGADCFRVNFSHGDGESLRPMLDAVREAAALEEASVALLADIQGPKLRIGTVPQEGVVLVEGEVFTLTTRDVEGSASIVQTRYAGLAGDVELGTRVLLADGIIELSVESIEGSDVTCRVVSGGRLFSNKGINLPGRAVSVETLTEKDRADLEFLAQTDIDLVAVSFVRRADDIELARSLLGGTRKVPLIAKLERPEALDNLESILDAADGIMVARGDLGVELPFEQVPTIQKEVLRRATERGVWVVVATQMLASMVTSPRPSRAEASDVLNAVLDGADAVMLSEETAMGSHPVLAVSAMDALAKAAEQIDERRHPLEISERIGSFAAAAAGAAVAAAERVEARAIVTLAGSGLTALLVSKWRPRLAIVALSSTASTLRRLNVLRGVQPVAIRRGADLEEQLLVADAFLIAAGRARVGDVIITVGAVPLGSGRETNTIRFHRVRGPGESATWRPGS